MKTGSRAVSIMVRVAGIAGAIAVLFLVGIFAVSEWKMRRTYDAPLVPLRAAVPADPDAGAHMARVVGCWAGCHGREGEGGFEEIEGIHKSAAPTLSQVVPQYSDEELVRLIRYGVKRNGRSAIGMISYATWPLANQDLVNIIAHLRAQPVLPPVPLSHDFTLRGRWAMMSGRWGVDADLVDRSLPRWGELPRNTPFERGRYLASIVCTACHGLDFRGSPLEQSPPLAIVAAYSREQFRHLLRTASSVNGRELTAMSWVRNVDFTDQEIDDLYVFLREHHGLHTSTKDRDAQARAAPNWALLARVRS
ncbi:MAG: c-type cytochrome [Steroidobacteraceae bacterium]